jgi:hypothetical protein
MVLHRRCYYVIGGHFGRAALMSAGRVNTVGVFSMFGGFDPSTNKLCLFSLRKANNAKVYC